MKEGLSVVSKEKSSIFSIGDRIRVYDFPVFLGIESTFCEGAIVDFYFEDFVFAGYVIECYLSSGLPREGMRLNVKAELGSNDFDDRIKLASCIS